MNIIYDHFGNTSVRVGSLKQNFTERVLILKNLFEKHPNLKWQSPKKKDYQDIESGTKLNLQYIYYKELQERDLIKPKEVKSIEIMCKDGRVGGSILSDLGLVDLDKNKILSAGQTLLDIKNGEIPDEINTFLQIDTLSLLFLKQLYNHVKTDKREKLFNKYIEVFRSLKTLNQYQLSLLILINNYPCINDFIKQLKSVASKSDIWAIIKKIIDENHKNDNNFDALGTAKGSKKIPDVKKFREYCISVCNSSNNFTEYQDIITNSYLKNNFINKLKQIDPTIFKGQGRKEKERYQNLNNFIKKYDISTDKNFYLWFKAFHAYKNVVIDYKDLSERYLRATDCFDFSDRMNIRPTENFELLVFHPEKNFCESQIKSISSFNASSLDFLLNDPFIKSEYIKKGVTTPSQLIKKSESDRIKKFGLLLKEKFSIDILINEILPLFFDHRKNEKKLHNLISPDADGPAMFEYIVAVAFCHLCKDPKLILSSNTKRDSNMLPTGFAPGGVPDFKADKGDHIFTIEPTLHSKDAIKQNEHEPVVRHLAVALEPLNTKKRDKSYAIFLAVHKSINMIMDCRDYANKEYYIRDDENRKIDKMNIMPLVLDDLIGILKNKKDYQETYSLFSDLFSDGETDAKKWYEEIVKPKINNL